MTKWPEVSLESVAAFERDVIEPEEISNGTRYIGLEHMVSGGGLVAVGHVDSGELASSKFAFSQKHVLYGKLRPYLAKVARPGFDGVCSTDILPILPGPNLSRDYLAWFLLAPETVARANSRASGANLPRISPKVLADFRIPLPPLSEQRRIANILDKADAMRAKRRAAFGQLETLKQSIFVEMFGDPHANSKGWPDNARLGDVAEVVSGITKGRDANGRITREIPYLAVVNVQDRSLDLSVVKTIQATDEEIQRYRLLPGDLLLTEGGDPDKLGRGTLWNGEINECIHQNHIFRVRLTVDYIDAKYLNWLVGSVRGKRYFLKSAKQTTGIASINMAQLRNFPLLLPPMSLQQEFAIRLQKVEHQGRKQLKSLSAFNELISSLQVCALRGEL